MILAVDVGNTTISVGGFVDAVLCFRFRMKTRPWRTAQYYEAALRNALAGQNVCGAVLSSVVPAVDAALADALHALAGRPPLRMSSELDIGLQFRDYDRSNLGMDRLADVAAARQLLGAPVAVFDLGTCTTVSVLDADSEFRGGMILPGLQLSLLAMHQGTAKLPDLEAGAPCTLIGRDTKGCMESGAVIGAAAVIDGFSKRIEAELGMPVPVVVTGGLGRLVLPWCEREVLYEPDLQLKGLYWIYQTILESKAAAAQR